MRTMKDVFDLVEQYREKYPWLKVKVSDEVLASAADLKTTHGIDAADELYHIYEREIEIELKTAALVKLGVPWDEAYQRILKIANEQFL